MSIPNLKYICTWFFSASVHKAALCPLYSFPQGINGFRHCVKTWMMHHILSLSLLALLSKGIYAFPAIVLERSVTQLSATDLSNLAPFTQFARAAYCHTSILQGWNCGGDCYFISI